ncbi:MULTISPECIES: polysaccharide biosynthesis tyrosine autokinase [Pseudidiomarina]|uniref:Tyrosine-protein kinase Etk/Wzc n=2 Tax=Pseudidiomarina TaxID=2800384 RepID=A0A368UMG6_9GAMM|nr:MULTISPECIES: polysaccharide biosynthesis tyrosine autokinase [Pseudidiomarina]PWW10376.1 tyrosine-protein kinase Etk/Wzc [Pseudidiomarina maritima]RBP87919.1 tyrosine-protein kinase Etk/Wzc [Pseudidiomarina tainanensis]RCW29962.1 tyrosine-protein kinase Etk/Wzc [Pseudidiomarina tainanensis]
MQNTPSPAQQQRHDDDEIDLGRLFGLLLDHKWLIVGITGAFMVLGVVYAMLSTPIYQADALLQVEKKSSGMPALGELSEMFAQESEAATEIEIMKSRMVVGAVVDQLKLTNVVQPNYLPVIGNFLARRAEEKDQVLIEALQVPQDQIGKALTLEFDGPSYQLFDSEGELALTGTVGQKASKGDWVLHIADAQTPNTHEFTLVKKSRLKAITDVQESLGISERGKQTGILSASIQNANGKYAQEVLNAVASEYMLQNIRRNAAEAENSLEFLERQIPTIKDNLNEAEDKLNQYRLESQSVDLSLETKGLLDQLVELEKSINELSLKEAELSRLYTTQHPTYQALIEQKANLQADRDRLANQIKDLPETQQQVLRYTRDVEVNQEIYLQLLNRMQELNVLKAGTVGNVRILDEAVVKPIPVAPKKPLIVVLATMLGGMLAVGIVFVRAMFNRGVESSEQLEQEGINVYASIPKSDTQENMNAKLIKLAKRKQTDAVRAPLLAKEDPTDLAIESLRGLRTSLHFAMLEARNNIIMISGPSPGVGKSFVTGNLAAVLAQTGAKVLLIDGDIRRGYLHNMMNAVNDKGLADLLAARDATGDLNYKAYTQSGYVDNLDFMPRGTSAPNPAELLMHSRMEQLMEQTAKDYDYVLIDTPPILAVTDAAIVGRYAGTTLLIARFGMTPAKELVHTVKRFEQNGVEVKGAILNSVERKASSYYGYGYNYHYGYAYKSE